MSGRFRNWASTVLIGAAALVFGCAVLYALPDKDKDNRDREDSDSRIQEGFRLVSELDLHLNGKNHALVGLGAYLVNAVGGCNDCHTNPPFADGGDPTLGQPKHLNKNAYLGGGTEFIPPQNGNPAIVSRNLTPDKTGQPEGGASFEEFRDIMRTGVDPDHAHPGYGPFLIVMPWPVYQGMTDHDLRAIYEFLSTLKCVEGDPGLPHPRPIGTRCQ
jgi:hypothetical protein